MLQIRYAKNYMIISLRYPTSLFKESTAKRLLTNYIDLISQCLSNMGNTLSEFELKNKENIFVDIHNMYENQKIGIEIQDLIDSKNMHYEEQDTRFISVNNIGMIKYLEQIKVGSQGNIICIPSLLSYSFEFMELVHVLPDINIFAFNMTLLNEYRDIEKSIDNIFNKCVNLILDKQLEQPISIIGYSTGARFGFELVKYLEVCGFQIVNFVVIDSPPNIEKQFLQKHKNKILDFISNNHPIFQAINNEDKEILLSTMNKYHLIDSHIVNNQKINTPIFVIKSSSHLEKEFHHWQNLTTKQVITYESKGSHFDLLSRKYIKENQSIFKEILCQNYANIIKS